MRCTKYISCSTLADRLIHSDAAELNVNNLSGMKLLEANY